MGASRLFAEPQASPTLEETANMTDHPYRNASLPIAERVEDLIGRMTLQEKAGQLFHDMIVMGPDGSLAGANPAYNLGDTEYRVCEQSMTHFNLLGPVKDVAMTAKWYNNLQKLAAQTRLGIPITMSTDPRNHFTENVGTSSRAGLLSQWPETLGLAALRSPELVEHFADVARQEYLALGLRVALHPQIDLATEPRWARINATFGEDADLSAALVKAYIRGFQGEKLGKDSVATMTKHFPGGGPQMDGEDPHFKYGREQVYPGHNREYHLRPFKAALKAGGSQIMPYYGMPIGTDWEEVGFALNRDVITGILRKQLDFEGIVCTDWGLITDTAILGQDMPARCWGAEHLTEVQRVERILHAGCDQFGGETRPELVVELVQADMVSMSRIDESLRRILAEKFTLGLFDHPFIDEESAVNIVGNEKFKQEGAQAQRDSYTLLTNKNDILPLSRSSASEPIKVYTENMDPELLKSHGLTTVSTPSEATIAILRLRAPYEPRSGGFERMFHAGSLEYPTEEKARQAKIYSTVPTIVDLYLDRPAIIPEIADEAAALLVNYGSSGDALLDIVFGAAAPKGRLPFDLPCSMAAVRESRSDMQYDTKNPSFRFGDGMGYNG